MEKQRIRHDLQVIADEGLGPQPNVWPRIRVQALITRATRTQASGGWSGRFLKPFFKGPKAAVTIPALMLFLVLSAAFTLPAVRATLEQRFGIVLTPLALPETRTAPDRPVPEATLAQPASDLVTLTDAQRLTPFPIPQPAWLPDDLTLQGVHVGYGPSGGKTREEARANAPIQIELVYRPHPQSTQGLFVQITHGQFEGGYAFPRDKAHAVTVNDQPAVYVQGAWNERRQWNDAAEYTTLSWEHDGLTYVMRASQLELGVEDMIRIATSIR